MSPVRDADTLAMLADVAGSFAQPDPERVRRVRDAGGWVDREMWSKIGDNGWFSILVPEGLGGAGLGIEAAAIVARRLGYAGFPEPFVAAGALAPLALAAAGEAGGGERLEALMAGESLVGVGWQGLSGGLDPSTCEVDAAADGDGAVLDGVCRFLHLADADAYLVAAREEGGISLNWVPAARLLESSELCADGSASAILTLDGVRVEPGDRLVGAGEGTAALNAALDGARIVLAAELTGLMDRALELTLDYLRERHQFGRPIGSYQALQFRAVDAWIQKELSDAALRAAIAVFEDPESGAGERAAAASSAKARAAHAAALVTSEALALHGAIGFTDEYELGLYINRSLTLVPWLGTAAEHRRRYGSIVEVEEG